MQQKAAAIATITEDWMAATATADDEILKVWQSFKKIDKESPDYEELRNRLVERYMPLVRYNGERIWQRLPDGVELDDVKWSHIVKAREYYDEHAVVPPIRKFAKYAGENQKDMFKLWMTGPMKPITKYGGLPKPTGCV